MPAELQPMMSPKPPILRQADPNDLFDLLLPRIDDGMLFQIASADYGDGVELHIAPLKLFRDGRAIPILDWHPAEVLELIRWSEPEQPDWEPGDTGMRGHLLRAFACSVLLRSYERSENRARWHSFNETSIQLADSLQALGGPMVPAGVRFFAWCVEVLAPLDPHGMEAPLLGFALLSLVLSDPTSADDDVVALCEWIDESVSALLQERQWWATRRKDWLLSTNHNPLRNARWIELGRSLYRWAESQPTSEKTRWVALLGRSLAEE